MKNAAHGFHFYTSNISKNASTDGWRKMAIGCVVVRKQRKKKRTERKGRSITLRRKETREIYGIFFLVVENGNTREQ